MKNYPKLWILTLCCLLSVGTGLGAQAPVAQDLVEALQDGGLVIVMRHANSPRQLPDAASADPANVNRERQLDEQGRNDAMAFGQALLRLRIVVAEVGVSPTFRALQTARLAGFSNVTLHEQLSNEGMNAAGANHVAWLRQQANMPPESGNHLFITHGPNVAAAFGELAEGMEEGEALVLAPSGAQEPALVARIRISEWASL